MKINQKGAIDMTLVAALAVVLIVGGFVLLRVTVTENANDAKTETSLASESSNEDENTEDDEGTEASIPEGFTAYSNEDVGMSFIYPEDWASVDLRPDETERGVVARFVSPEQQASYDAFVESGRQTDGPYPYDVTVSNWPSINNENARGGTAFPQPEYASLDEFLNSSDIKSKAEVGKVMVSGVEVHEVSIGGLGTNYGLMAETDNGIVELSFINVWDKDNIDETTQDIIDSLQLF